MRFVAFGLVLSIGLLAGMPGKGFAEGDSASIWVESYAGSVKTTESIDVDIFADIPAPGVAVWWLDIKYNPELLFADYCLPPQGVSPAGFCHSTDTPGTIRAWGEVEAGLVGRYRLARLPLTAIGPTGSHSDITIESVKFAGPAGDPLPVETYAGSVDIEGQGSHSLITGIVFNDANGNGVQDAGEGSISRSIQAASEQMTLYGSSKSDGAYLIPAFLSPGDYSVEASFDEFFSGVCSEGPGSFSPLQHPGCIPGARIEWEVTTPQQIALSIEPGSVSQADFGGRRRDRQTVLGTALLGEGPASDGTEIRAWVNGTLCGEIEAVKTMSNFNFTIQVLGQRERLECASDGDTVSFTVGKVPATQTLVWKAEETHHYLDLVAMPEHSWLWAEQPAPNDPGSLGTPVEAIVDGKVCASTTIARTYQGFMSGPPPIGFSRLAVPSDTLSLGCGSPGKTIAFRIGGEISPFTTTWEPGLHRIDLPLPGMGKAGDYNCSGGIGAEDALGILIWIAEQGRHGRDCRIPVDVDCDERRTAIDALHILRFVAGLPSRVPDGCPGVGA